MWIGRIGYLAVSVPQQKVVPGVVVTGRHREWRTVHPETVATVPVDHERLACK